MFAVEIVISIDDIHELKYVALRFGKLPLSQIEKIKYFDSYPFVYQELSHTDQFAWIVYGGVEHSIGELIIFLLYEFWRSKTSTICPW